jgi:hypothetical protein
MSWNARGQHGPYFYHSFRVDGRVHKIYVGRGQQAEELARQIEQCKQGRQAQREAVQKELVTVHYPGSSFGAGCLRR